jgi:pimeloyl-ACP methyl ester carboxylesterase
MAPELVRRGLAANVVALDSPGHGMSSHKSPDCPQLLADYVFYVAEVAKQLEWDKFTVVGHSMGAAVSVMFASCFPEKVESLVLLDGFAPAPRDAHEISTHIRRAVETRLKTNQRLYPQFSSNELSLSSPPRGSNVYPNIEMAIEARIKTATSSPGSQSISPEAARALVERATIAAKTSNSGGVQFRHDPRLNWPSIQYLTREQVEAVLLNISCPVCLLMAADGWPIDVEVQHEIVDLILKPKMYLTLAGSHHLHADPDTAIAVVDNVEQFLNSLSC